MNHDDWLEYMREMYEEVEEEEQPDDPMIDEILMEGKGNEK